MNLLRHFSSFAVIFTGIFALTALSAQADIKSATVDVNKLLAEYHVAIKDISVLQAERDEYVKEREERQKALKEVEEQLKVIFAKIKNKAMPKAERENLDEEREDLISQHNALSKDLKESDLGQINETKQKLAAATRKLLDQIQVVIRDYAKDNGYHWIIDTSGVSNTQISPLVYAKNAPDVTAEILAILNKDAPKKEKEGAETKTPPTPPATDKKSE